VDKPYALLVRGYDFSKAPEDEFNDWYDTEHIPERERTAGFVKAERWISTADPKISVAIYDLESFDVLQSAGYKAISGVNLSPWSRRVVGKLRAICHFQAEQTLPGRQAGTEEASGMMFFAMNVPPEIEDEYNAWYNEEHIPALLKVPGVLLARRFRIVGGTHRHLAVYHLATPEVEGSQAWKDAVGTPWTAKMRPHFRDPLRLVMKRHRRAAGK
jgi:hypothetical protein